MTNPGELLALQSEAEEIVGEQIQTLEGLIGMFHVALGPESVGQLSALLSIPVQQESGDGAESDADTSREIETAIIEAIADEVEPMIDEVLAELEQELGEGESIDEDDVAEIISQVLDEYLNEIRRLLGI